MNQNERQLLNRRGQAMAKWYECTSCRQPCSTHERPAKDWRGEVMEEPRSNCCLAPVVRKQSTMPHPLDPESRP